MYILIFVNCINAFNIIEQKGVKMFKMATGSGVFYGVSRKPGRLLDYSDFTPGCGALQA